MTAIRAETVRLTAHAALPERWAVDLGSSLVADLPADSLNLLQERVVPLGHGVQLAHIRTPHVQEPTLGVFKATDANDHPDAWLWLVVLVPQAEASRHLGWMAHLAAVLHDTANRSRLQNTASSGELHAALQALLEADVAPQRFTKADAIAVPKPTTSHRLIVVILKEIDEVDRLLEAFVDHDIRGATIIEARGMAEHLAMHMSLFAGFRSALRAVGHSQVVLSVIPTERTAEVLAVARDIGRGFKSHGSGVAFALDVPAAIGLDKGE